MDNSAILDFLPGSNQQKSENLKTDLELDLLHPFFFKKLSYFLASEINDPLTILHSHVQELKKSIDRKSITVEQLQQSLDRIGGTQQKISRLLKHIRHLSEASGTRESAKAVFLHNLTSDCLELCHSRLLQYQIQVKMEVSPSLIVSARAYEIMQIFINLIENSIQANKITPSPWIQIQATKEADFAMVTFTDSGLGLHRTALENFDKATAPGQKLTLHGLPIADYLAKANGGSLQIIKNPENSQLILRLPLYKNFQKS